jgi:hypothetical protein
MPRHGQLPLLLLLLLACGAAALEGIGEACVVGAKTGSAGSAPTVSAPGEMAASSSKAALMPVLRVVRSGIAHPFGDARTVNQAFPSVISAEEADPFLMCDYFDGPFGGKAKSADDFPVGWHVRVVCFCSLAPRRGSATARDTNAWRVA